MVFFPTGLGTFLGEDGNGSEPPHSPQPSLITSPFPSIPSVESLGVCLFSFLLIGIGGLKGIRARGTGVGRYIVVAVQSSTCTAAIAQTGQ